MKRKIALMGLLVVTLVSGFVLTKASALTTDLLCVDDHGNNVQLKSPIPLNTHVTCTGSTPDTKVKATEIKVTDPKSGIVLDKSFSGKSGTVDFIANLGGVWLVEADFFGKGGVNVGKIIDSITVSFSVVPESPIGTAALVGSSIAALGGFMALRHHSRPKL